ncbi:hypothetical protein ACUSIJ_08360 [Pseudochelatococcus sp. B33]
MSSHSPALGEALLDLPAPWAKTWRRSAPVSPDGIRERLSLAHFHAREQARAGEEIFRVVVALQDSVVDDLLPSTLSSFTHTLHSPQGFSRDSAQVDSSPDSSWAADGRGASDSARDRRPLPDAHACGEGELPDAGSDDADCVFALRAQAVALVAAGDIGGAITVLCALLDWPAARNDALLGLAICALRLERHDAALALALDYLKRGGKHPRAHCIVGVCHLRKGDRRAAQNHLAIAARAARGDTAFRDELRAAQRLLIVLNFGR